MKRKLSLQFIVCIVINLFSYCLSAQTPLRPCRLNDSLNSDVLFLGLGNPSFDNVKQGDFDIEKDRVLLNNQQVIDNYYKQVLGLKYFKPIDKSIFKQPATGWCSWYYYYQDLDLEATLLNAKWLGQNLKDFGLKYVQIDDAWQDKGIGEHNNRDWTNTNIRFSKYGMDSLASFIRKQGFVPGLWIVPHGQSNKEIVKNSGTFLVDKQIKSTIQPLWGGWVGDYCIDPTSPKMPSYLDKLFLNFKYKGFDYFKIDGQSLILPDYVKFQSKFSNPKIDAVTAYRSTLEAIRKSVGKDVFLLGCWQTPVEGLGYFNGSRSNGDIYASVKGFSAVLEAVRAGYFLHNTGWYVDPDPVMVGDPLSLDAARMWASVIGLTGMSTFCSEKMFDLSPIRVDILKKILPAQNVYPIDLFRYSKNKTIYDLKIKNQYRSYDVVGVFNFQVSQPSTTLLDWQKLGLNKNEYYHVYDFWNEEYVGCFNHGLFVNLNAASCKVFSIMKSDTLPQLISSNRHITQGAEDILVVKLIDRGKNNSEEPLIYEGKSKVVKENEYKLVFATPIQTPMGYQLITIKFGNEKGKIYNSKGLSFGSFVPSESGEVLWQATFKRVKNYASPQKGDFPEKLKLTSLSTNQLQLNFDKGYGICFAYLLERNGVPLGYATQSPIFIQKSNSELITKYTATETYNNFLPSALKYDAIDSITTKLKTSIDISNESSQSNVCYHPIITAAPSNQITFYGTGTKTYSLNGNYESLQGKFGVANYTTHYYSPKASLEVYGDGKLLFKSSIKDKKQEKESFSISVKGVKNITFYSKFVQEQSDWGNSEVSDIALLPISK